jgi:DNA polymerase III subunit chi
MTRIDFYQIDSDEPPLLFTCRLIEKIYRKGLQVYIHAMSEEQATELDDLLWSFRSDRFIPHTLASNPDEAPIKIGCSGEPEEHQEVLINLAADVPDFFSRFDRVAEIVPLGEERRVSARQNYRFYKDRGYSLQYHQIKQAVKQKNG